MGCVTPLGHTVSATWDALIEGRNAIGPIQRFDASGFVTTFAAEIRDFTPPPLEGRAARWSDAKGQFAVAAAQEALADAGLAQTGPAPHRFGVSVGAEVSRPELGDMALRLKAALALPPQEALRGVDPKDFVVMSAFFPATLLAAVFNARGPNLTTSTACTSSSQSIADAVRVLRRGDADVMLAGGTDRLVEELMVMGFGLLGALSTRNEDPAHACRPFDRTRDGFVLGEGAGFLVLETEAHAQARGARIHAELMGYGWSANAWRITDSPSDGRGARASMTAALKDAGLAPDDVGYINAHGTSTQQNDASETAGIHGAFGAHAQRVPVSSTKSMMGHLVAACGAVELIACVKAIQTGVLPPTINYEHPDPACDLDYIPEGARSAAVDVALTNAFGFGGSNGSLVVGRYR
ncbi:MAG: beta-ketoacyl-[acyl-carrier-protein] synthase family protein [Myxococcales bacterium]|nr:beta-ketoacyl-[acyl-carrier-protein] synthase family protein [Myxococcales bacterium]